MPPTKPHKQMTPPGGYPTCEGCVLMESLRKTVYGDPDNCQDGLVKTTNEIKTLVQTLVISFNGMKSFLKWLGLGSLPSALALYYLLR